MESTVTSRENREFTCTTFAIEHVQCSQSKLDKIGRLGYQLKYMLNKNVCMTTKHNFLTVISKEDALLYQTAANLLKDAISDSTPTPVQ